MNKQNIYQSLGVETIINAAGTFTDLGGSLMLPEVISAWAEAAEHFVDLQELLDRVGERIAGLLNVDAALVTSGAANGIMLGTAAAITIRDPAFVNYQVQSKDGQPYEVIRQKSHRDPYDRQLECCGIKIIEVECGQDVERVVSDRTVLLMAYNLYEPASAIKHEEWLRLADKYSLPTLLDAAADTPPVENLRRYTQMGFDLVAYSGGKAIRGPQDSGLLVGRRVLIQAAKRNAAPYEGAIGRVSKVSKEDIVAFWRALEVHVACGDQIQARCEQQLRTLESILHGLPTVRCQLITPKVANQFPHLQIEWDPSAFKMNSDRLAVLLRNGSPPIATRRVFGTGDSGLLISAINLRSGEERVVGERIREILRDFV